MMCFWFQLYKYLLSTIFLKILRKELKLKSLFHYYAKRIFPIHHISKQKVQVNIKLVQSTGKQWGAYHLHKQQCRSAGHLTTILSSGRIYSLVEWSVSFMGIIPYHKRISTAKPHSTYTKQPLFLCIKLRRALKISPLYPESLGYQNWYLLGFQTIWLVLNSFGGEVP